MSRLAWPWARGAERRGACRGASPCAQGAQRRGASREASPCAPGEGGGVALLTVLAGAMLAALVLVVVASVVDLAVAHARASAAADAAALAAANASPLAGGEDNPRSWATRLAEDNGAEVSALGDEDWPLRVTVEVAVPTRMPIVRGLVPEVRAEAAAALSPR